MKYKYIECWIGNSDRYMNGKPMVSPMQFLPTASAWVTRLIFKFRDGSCYALVDGTWQPGCPPPNVFYSEELDSDYAELLESYAD